MLKNGKTKLKKENLLNIIARTVAEIKDNMATKDDIADMATKSDIKKLEIKTEDTERRLSTKMDVVDEKLDALEEVDIRGLQRRVFILEKDVKQIKNKNV